jgi:hypothetical protein
VYKTKILILWKNQCAEEVFIARKEEGMFNLEYYKTIFFVIGTGHLVGLLLG